MRRAISTSAVRKALEMRGATREQIRQNNPGEAGENALKAIDDIEAAAEQKARSPCDTLWKDSADLWTVRRKSQDHQSPRCYVAQFHQGP
ncbi:hypothetical protein HII31_11964 [Pseudocercospora fuligena]|uniref:Uncharacterized protein n=1 Tax=Pseudocercospora fuligena TaxID=685502 RepID=A0A8H6VDM7_9PEZI|nr:hypothetical protein HII31_11964 [Pseudocercospora fuligena]